MFDAILRFSVKKKLFVGLTTLFLLIGGIYSMLTLTDCNRVTNFGSTRGGATYHNARGNRHEQYHECH